MKHNFFYQLFEKIRTISWLQNTLSSLNSFRYSNKIAENRKQFQKHAVVVLETFDKCLTEIGVNYSLAFGTMLGAVREKGIIKHDLDLDVVLWVEDYTPNIRKKLQERGFRLVHELLVADGLKGREESYSLHGVKIDLFFIYPAIDEFPYCCDFYKCEGTSSFKDSMKKYGRLNARRLQLPWKKDFVRVPFERLTLPICKNFHEILSFRYGLDYMTPNPNWNYLDLNKYISLWPEELAVMKY
jgi:phosphorylcholine metabolism protein LicD